MNATHVFVCAAAGALLYAGSGRYLEFKRFQHEAEKETTNVEKFDKLNPRAIVKHADETLELHFRHERECARAAQLIGTLCHLQEPPPPALVRTALLELRRSVCFDERFRVEYENLWYATQRNGPTTCGDLKRNLRRVGLRAPYACGSDEAEVSLATLLRQLDSKLSTTPQ